MVQPLPADRSSLTVRLGVHPGSRKVAQLEADPHVTLVYADVGGHGYVTLKGTAALCPATDERRLHWKSSWIAFFPDGPLSDGFVNVEFTPSRVEVMSFKHSVTPEPFGLRPACLCRTATGAWELDRSEGMLPG